MKTILTRNQGKMTLRGPLTTPGYKTPQQKSANGFAQKLMSRGSFDKPSCEPKMGASNFKGQGRAESIPMGSDLPRGKNNFPK